MYTKQLEQVVHAINPGARPSGEARFPPNLPSRGARRRSGESARHWLHGCIELLGGGVDAVAIEDTLALFVELHWAERAISYANIQALWTSVPLREFVDACESPSHQYLRLDYHPDEALGQLLKEPHPHLHVDADGEPRFPVPLSASKDVVGWFVDFVYRNFFYEDWIAWAKEAWDHQCRETNRENRWPRLVQAFNQSKLQVILADDQLRKDLDDLKQCLAEKRSRIFRLQGSSTYLDVLAHECTVAM